MASALEGLVPASLWRHFDEIRKIPRDSTKEEGVRIYLRAVADAQGWTRQEDEAGNLVLRVPGKGRGVGAAPLAIQGHMDMVCVKDERHEHDFERDPIDVLRATVTLDGDEVDVVTANGTTLGSDNGIGCCAGLALGLASEIDHPPLELLFTADEETGMTGASNLDASMVRARRLINLDAEEMGSLYVSCAGGRDLVARCEYERSLVPSTHRLVHLACEGFTGGHSGVDIDDGRENAIVEAVRLVACLSRELDGGICLNEIVATGRSNAIPKRCGVSFWIAPSDLGHCEALVFRGRERLKRHVGTTDPNADVVMTIRETPPGHSRLACTVAQSAELCAALSSLRNGVFSWSASVEGLVETSSNIGVLMLQEGRLELQLLSRSSIDAEILRMQEQMANSLEHIGATVELLGAYPGWKADLNSPLLKVACESYQTTFGASARVKAIHAGLECGILRRQLEGVDMVSFGPEIRNAHTTSEMVVVDSVTRFWKFLTALVSALCDR